MYIPGIANEWFERFMLVVLMRRGVRSAHQSLRMVRSTWPSVDIERDIVSKSGAGMPGCTFLLWNLIGPYGTLGRPFACFERFYESSCLLCVVMMMVMIELPPSISQNRRYESTVSGNRTRIFEYTPVRDAPASINARILLWMKSLDVVTLEAMSSRDLSMNFRKSIGCSWSIYLQYPNEIVECMKSKS